MSLPLPLRRTMNRKSAGDQMIRQMRPRQAGDDGWCAARRSWRCGLETTNETLGVSAAARARCQAPGIVRWTFGTPVTRSGRLRGIEQDSRGLRRLQWRRWCRCRTGRGAPALRQGEVGPCRRPSQTL